MLSPRRIPVLALAALVLTLGSWGVATDARADATCDTGGGPAAMTEPLEGQSCAGDMVIQAGTTSTLNGAGTVAVTGNLTIETGATLDVLGTDFFATLNVGGDFDLQTNATIDLDGRSGVTEPAGTGGAGNSAFDPSETRCAGSGAGHGGVGGVAGRFVVIPGGNAYGISAFAQHPGSTGGQGTINLTTPGHPGGVGGGAIRIVVGGLTTLDGLITAVGLDGETTTDFSGTGGAGGGGSGGSIYLRTGDLTTHNPGVHLDVSGGDGGDGTTGGPCTPGGSGAGGRISVYHTGQNGTGTGVSVDPATHMNCAGGIKGEPSATNGNGEDGTCLLAPAGSAPQLDAVTPDTLGQGATTESLVITGQNFVAESQLEIAGASPGRPNAGITINSITVDSDTQMTAVVSVDYTADPSPGANPKAVRVLNPDLNDSGDQPLFSVSQAPVIDHVEEGGSTVTGLPRGFTGPIVVFGSNLQVSATLAFASAAITVTGTPVVDIGAQTLTVDIAVSTTAAAGPVAFNLTNPDHGTTQTPGSLDVLSQPVITALSPDTLIVGQTATPVTVTGSGFIAASQVVSGSADVVVESTQFDGFGQLTATISVDVAANLATATRDLTVDNGDGGVSSAATLTLEAVPAGVNAADLVYSDGGALTPPDRFWNGFGWGAAGTAVGALPEAPDWVVTRPGRTSGDVLLATVDATRRLHLTERTGGTWGAPVGPISVATAGRPVDAAAVAGGGGERFLAVYGEAGSNVPTFRLIGGSGATGAVTAVDTACTGGTEIRWVRLVANGSGTRAVLVYAPDNQALCAIEWNGTTFDAATERVLVEGPDALASLTTQAFDVTYWGSATPQQAMVAWGLSGSGTPGYAVWDGTTWSVGSALAASSGPTQSLVSVRLAASAQSNRVALATDSGIGELFAQIWGGSLWGGTVKELPTALVANPDAVAGAGTTRAFDVVWPATLDSATVVYGISGEVALKARRWTSAAGWESPTDLTAPAGAGIAAWVQLREDPAGGDLLAGAVGAANILAYYHWNGVSWAAGRALASAVPTGTEAFMAAYRAAPPPAAPVVTGVTYDGVSPPQIGARATAQTIEVTGSGFLNPPTVSFNSPSITVDSVQFQASTRLLATVTIGDVSPGTYALTLQNPDGQSVLFANGLVVVAPPDNITVRLGAGAPACTPTVTGATACGFQDTATVPVEVVGTGFVDGAGVVFGGSGVDFLGTPVFSVEGGTGNQILAGDVRVLGTAAVGAGDVTVTNPDTSTGTGTGVFEVRSFVDVTSVTPSVLGTGARTVTLDVRGRNFQSGLGFSFGSGVSVASVVWNGPTQALVMVDVSSAAAPGGRTVTVTNLDGGTAAVGGLFSVAAGPSISSVTPTQGDQGTTVAVTVDGTDLSPLAASGGLVFSGSGITVQNVVQSATQITFDAVIQQSAPFTAARDLTLKRDNLGQVTVTGAFTVLPVPVITNVTPATVTANELGRQITLNGSGFEDGAQVTAESGLTIRNQQVVSSGQIVLTADVGSTTGPVNLVVNNPSGRVSAPKAVTVVATQACTVGSGEVLTVSPNGTLACTSLSVSGTGQVDLQGDLTFNVLGDATLSGGTLTADPATTFVRLRVGGNLTVASGAVVDASATGYAGGTLGDPGEGPGGGAASGTSTDPDDSGRGGGYGGAGGNGDGTGGGPTYDILGTCTDPACFEGMPLDMGSGGGSGIASQSHWRPGGAGGGSLVLDVTGTVTVDGAVRANGGDASTVAFNADGEQGGVGGRGAGGGSGGAILVLAGGGISGAGTFESLGGNVASPVGGDPVLRGTGGGGGRIAVYTSGVNGFTGTLDCSGGTSNNPDPLFQGEVGTCISGTTTSVTNLTPSSVGQGVSTSIDFQGVGLEAGDTVIVRDSGFTWGPLTGTGPFSATLDVASNAPIGVQDVIIRHADQTGGIAFDGLRVGSNPLLFSLTPDHLAQGDVGASVQISGSLIEPAGATVTFLRGGVEAMCLDAGSNPVPCLTATVNEGASSSQTLDLTVTVEDDAQVGGYVVRVLHAGGGEASLAGGFAVVSTARNVPALMRVSPTSVGEEVASRALTLSGYDFGVPPSFAVTGAVTSDPNVTITFDPAGCPQTPATCVTDPLGLQRIDAFVSTVGATAGSALDVAVSGPGGGSTLTGALTVNPRPTVTGFTPTSGESTFTLTVSGTGFASGAVISLADAGPTVGATTTSGADLTASVTVPSVAATTTTQVRVTNPDGGMGELDGLVLNPAPVVSSVTPSTLSASQSATVSVQGSNFHPSATVAFGAGITVSNRVFVSSGEIQVTATIAASADPGPRDVTVTNPNGGQGTLTDGFTVGRPVVLSVVSPAAVGAGGTHVLLLQGAEFDANLPLSRVTISGTGITKLALSNYRSFPVGEVTVTSVDLLMSVDANATAGVRTVTVRNADGTQSSASLTINPAPVVSFVDPGTARLGEVVPLTLNGFNLDAVAPRICFGAGCDFGASSSTLYVTGITPVNPNRVDLTLQVAGSTSVGLHPVTVRNPDGGQVTKADVLNVVAGFDVTVIPDFEIPIGTTGFVQDLAGTGFTDSPAAPQVAFLLPSGAVDPNIGVVATYLDTTTIRLSITVGAGAAPGVRTIRVTNGDGAVRELANFLLVTQTTGPTIGVLSVPPAGGAVAGLDADVTRGVTGATLTGSGLAGSGAPGGEVTLALLPTGGAPVAGFTATVTAVAPDGKSATVDLDLPVNVPPGAVQVTATTDEGTDARAGALTITPAPAVTTLQPASLIPGSSGVSVLISGGAFQDGAEISVSPAASGVTARDFDTSVTGTQALFVSDALLRTAVDVTTLASGDFTLSVTNPDGGRGGALLPVREPTLGTPAKIAHMQGTAPTGLKVRDWIGAPELLSPIQSGTAALAHSATRADVWTELRSNPASPGEYLLAVGEARTFNTLQSALRIYRTLADGTNWEAVPLVSVGALSSDMTQAFDLAYEQSGSGRALVVYGVGTSLLYQTIDAGGASGAASVLVGGTAAPFATGAPVWVRLVPQAGTARILVVYMTATRQIQALIWDGASGTFNTQYDGRVPAAPSDPGGIPLTTNGPQPDTQTLGVLKRGFDGAWEALSGRAVAFWGQDGTNALRAVTWSPAAGWGTPAATTQVITGTGPSFLEAEADPFSDRIAVLSADNNANRRALVARFHVGGAWEAGGTALSTNIGAVLTAQIAGQNFDMAWDDDGGLVALFSSREDSHSRLLTRHWAAGVWDAPTELVYNNRLYTAVEVEGDPESGEMLATTLLDPGPSTSLDLHMFRWNGNGWTDRTFITPGVVHWPEANNGGNPLPEYGTAMTVAYREDGVPPDPVVLAQTDATTTTATVQWTATGDNGTAGQAGGYDIRWSDQTIEDDGTVADCGSPPAGVVCFSNANQVRPSPTPGAPGATESVEIDFGASGVYTVAVKVGDRPNLVDSGSGAETAVRNVSAISNVLTVTTVLVADPVPPEAVTDLAAAAGPDPQTTVNLSWTGVGDDGDLSTTDPVRGYDVRMATLPISEAGGDNNFHVPFDQATRLARVSAGMLAVATSGGTTVVPPATDGGGGTRGVANAFTVTGLDSGTTYYFAVKGLDEDPTVQAAVSNSPGHTTDLVVPDPIDDLMVGDVGPNEVTLVWTARGGGPTSYELRFDTTAIATDADFDAATPVGGLPAPAADGTRQAFTVRGLLPDTFHAFALVPVRFVTDNDVDDDGIPNWDDPDDGGAVAGVLVRVAPAFTTVSATTTVDPDATPTQPSPVTDLAVVPGTVRSREVRLEWTAPATSGAQALRYELRWAHQPLSTTSGESCPPAPGGYCQVALPLLPATTGTAQEYTLQDLPENARVYIGLISYDRSGLASDLSNQVLVHTALRGGMNGISVPGSFGSGNDIGTLLGPYVGSCTSTGGTLPGSGPVGGCGVGEATVIAYRWDSTAAADGDFVAMDQAETVEPGVGIFVQANGDQAVLDVAGSDLPSFPPVAIPQNAPALVANPYLLPVAVANLRVRGDDGYDQDFGTAVADGVIDPTLLFFTRVNGVLQYVAVTDAEVLLPYRAYFIQLGAMADPAVNYSLEVLHP